MFIIILLIFIIIYTCMFYLKLDNIDKKSIKLSIKNGFKMHEGDFSLLPCIKYIFHFLIIPFKKKDYFKRFTTGGIYSTYIYNYYPKLASDMNNKLYWNSIFKKHNINHPQLICYKKKDKIVYVNNINPSKYYISKPITGALGYNVKKIKGSDVNKVLNKSKNIIVQEYLYDCIYKKPRFIRVVTLYNGEIFNMYMRESTSKKSIAPNASKKTNVSQCDNNICNRLSDHVQRKVNNMSNQLAYLHVTNYKEILTIGWDVVINCENNDTKIYCLEGNVCNSVYTKDVDTKKINEFSDIVRKYYNENNIK